MDHDAEVIGIGVGSAPDGEEVPAIVLAARDEYLPIFVTQDQAESIRLALAGEPFDRPLTHDLMVDMVTEFGGAIDAIRIDDLTDGTFYAKLDVETYDDGRAERHVFDARPSDAIALAVRSECAISVSNEVLDAAGQSPDAMDFVGEGGSEPDAIGRGSTDEPDHPAFGGEEDDERDGPEGE